MTRRSQQQYPPELRERAVRMVAEVTANYESQWAAITAVAQKLGVGTAETVRKWVRQAETDAGQRPGTTTAESEELKRLRRENAELKRAPRWCSESLDGPPASGQGSRSRSIGAVRACPVQAMLGEIATGAPAVVSGRDDLLVAHVRAKQRASSQ